MHQYGNKLCTPHHAEVTQAGRMGVSDTAGTQLYGRPSESHPSCTWVMICTLLYTSFKLSHAEPFGCMAMRELENLLIVPPTAWSVETQQHSTGETSTVLHTQTGHRPTPTPRL